MAILDVQHIEKSFGATKVLKDINFSLPEGQVLAIIGSSGSGKDHLAALPELFGDPGQGEHFRAGRDPVRRRGPRHPAGE